MSKKVFGPTYFGSQPSAIQGQLSWILERASFASTLSEGRAPWTHRHGRDLVSALPWRRLHFHLTPNHGETCSANYWNLLGITYILIFTGKNYYLFSTFVYKFPKRFWLSEILFSIFSVWSSYRSSYNYPRLLCISLPFITLPLPLVSQKSDWSGYVSETFWCSKYRSFKMSARNWSIL